MSIQISSVSTSVERVVHVVLWNWRQAIVWWILGQTMSIDRSRVSQAAKWGSRLGLVLTLPSLEKRWECWIIRWEAVWVVGFDCLSAWWWVDGELWLPWVRREWIRLESRLPSGPVWNVVEPNEGRAPTREPDPWVRACTLGKNTNLMSIVSVNISDSGYSKLKFHWVRGTS